MGIIEIKNVYKIFGPRPKEARRMLAEGASKNQVMKRMKHTIALQEVTLDIKKGETFVIMGLSGSGKSTLVRCLNRLIKPTSGEILVDGEDILAYSDKELRHMRQNKMSMVFQRFALLPHRTVQENVAYGLEIQGVDSTERNEQAEEWLQTVGLGGWESSYPNELSGGMQQRVGIARALCTDPEILLMDEPFSALDPLIRREMQDELINLQARLHKTIVFITHDLDEALHLGDRIAILKDGRVVQVGTPEEILTNPSDEYVADFTRDVNRVRALTANTVMITPRAMMKPRGGPRLAMKFMEEQGVASVFVVDHENRLVGMLTAETALSAIESGITDITEKLLYDDLDIAHKDTYLEELLPLAARNKWPIAVLDDEKRLVGIIPRVSILSALADRPTVNGGTSYTASENTEQSAPVTVAA